MEIIKKNIGLIIAAAVSLVLCIFLGVKLIVNKGQLAEVEKKISGEIGFFDKVRKSKIRVLPDSGVVVNVVQAQKNAEKAAEEYKNLCKNLGTRYQINPKLPSTSTEAIRWIRENLEEMAEFAVQNDMMIQDLGHEFNLIVSQGNLAVNEFRTVFRMLYVYRRLVEILAKSGVKEVFEIKWPLLFGVHEMDRYTVTPINISIAGDGDTIQTFLNNMSSDTKMLFYVRTLRLDSTDEFSAVVAGRARETVKSDEQKMLDGGRNIMPDTRQSLRGRNQRETQSSTGADERKDGYPAHWVKLDPQRQDRFGYMPARVSLKVRFDLLEFKVDEKADSTEK